MYALSGFSSVVILEYYKHNKKYARFSSIRNGNSVNKRKLSYKTKYKFEAFDILTLYKQSNNVRNQNL